MAKLNCSVRIPHSSFEFVSRFELRILDLAPKFLLAICRSVRTLAVHEACQAVTRHYIFAWLLCSDGRGTEPFAG